MRVGVGGVELSTEDASIEIDADDLIRLLPDVDVDIDISADWRLDGGAYKASDTQRLAAELGARVEGNSLRLEVGGDVLFDFGSAVLRRQAAVELAKVAHLIRQRSAGEVHVVGHTDSIGSDAANLKLSQERAIAVMLWLHEQEGIPVAVMRGRGMGSKEPIAHNTKPNGRDDPEGRARNRRVEISFSTVAD